MRQFFSNLFSNPEPTDFSVLGTDMHSHLLPGLDDGVPSLDEALEVIEALGRLGYRRVITTPHVMSERYLNDSKTILEKAGEVKEAVRKAGIPVEFSAAAEYFIDDHFGELLEKDDLLPLDGSRLILVEMSFLHAPLSLQKYMFDLQTRGYKPVLAHPERYPYYHNRLEEYKALKEMGCRFQVNMLSITGHYGLDIQQSAELLLRHKMVDFLGSDIHRARQAQTVRAALRSGHLEKTLRKYTFQNAELGAANPPATA